MNDYLIAEFVGNIDEIVKQPIHLTQRIKYTSCDVSQEYIVFGASSGGLYVFHRHPCSFDKLIPSTEGSVIFVSISPDEKIFAFATSKGTICLVEINSRNVDIQVYNEHIGNLISAMKWNDQSDELFVGDNTGKISVIINANFITKTMFQTPCSPLLQLDSRIVQIDSCCNFLLVSTLSRCYLCDTEKEQYRQIGHKLRDGEFGSCFFGTKGSSSSSFRQQSQIGSFKVLGEKETFNTTIDLENSKIFCARPGLRLWEVQLNGSVVRTHQFKQALNTVADNVVPVKEIDCRLEIQKHPVRSSQNPTFNFIKMYVLNRNFIITFKKDNIYVLDPINGKVIVWIDQYSNIIDIKIVKNFIYVLTQKYKIHVLLFSSLENFILKSLFNKQYLLCADLCINYEKVITKIIPSSKKIHLLISLDEKLLELNEIELRDKLNPIFCAIKEQSEERQKAQRLNCGIFVIDNAHYVNNEISENFEGNSSEIGNNSGKINEKNLESEPGSENLCVIKDEIDNNRDISRIYEQYELDKAIGNYNSKVLIDILNDCNLDNVYNIFIKLEQYALNLQTEKTDIQLWCYEKCLYYIFKNRDYILLIFNSSLNEGLGIYLRNAFTALNLSPENSCSCFFPLPKASQKIPKFFEIGCCVLDKIINNTEMYTQFCSQVPYMWRQVLKLQQNEDLNNILPLLIQYSDEEIIDIFLKKFTYDHWHDALKLFVLLKSGKCLKCENVISGECGISWTNFTTKMLKSIGAERSIELLMEFANDIPSSTLETHFYQSAIFSSMMENFQSNLRIHSIDFVKKINDSECKEDFGNLLGKSLQNPNTRAIYHKPVTTNNMQNEENCSGCLMPFHIPILFKEDLIFLKCGHCFHTICYKHQKNICNICNINESVM